VSTPRARLKPERASLIGGIVVGIASLVLWVAVTRELGFQGAPVLVVGLLVSAAAGIWTRLADL
jgi:hypothetical protein